MANNPIIRQILKNVFNIKRSLETPTTQDIAKQYATRIAQNFNTPAIEKLLFTEEDRTELSNTLGLFGLRLYKKAATYYIGDEMQTYVQLKYAFGTLMEILVACNIKDEGLKAVKGY